MSYVLADSTGALCDFASIGGYADFQAWARTQAPAVRRFVQFGYTEDLQGVVQALEGLKAPQKVEEQRQLLLLLARRAEDILILSDGMSSEEELETLASSKDNEIHAAADRYHKQMLVTLRYAFAKGRAAVDRQALNRAASDASQALQRALQETLPPLLARIFEAGVSAGAERLQKKLRTADDFLQGKLDTPNEWAAAWAREHGAELIDGLTKTTRDEIAEAVANAHETGELDEAYDTILAAVGDEERAQLVTQTETMTSALEGQRALWDDAVEKGLLTGQEKRVWIAADGCCDACNDLDGETADLDGEYPNDGGSGPLLHPRCRCTEGLAF